jgi:spoIIIJ-associated protein
VTDSSTPASPDSADLDEPAASAAVLESDSSESASSASAGSASSAASAGSAGSAGPAADAEDGEEKTSESVASDGDLFRQSEIAADYVEGLLDILDYDGDIDELVSAGRPMVEVVGGRLQPLVGQRGATLEALQELTRLAIFRATGTPSRLLLDIGGYRATRRKELAAVARNAVEKVKEHGDVVRLEPMSAFERKCVHDVVNAIDGVQSESEGVEPNRRIVVRAID